MPRQPYLQVIPNPRGVKYDIGSHCIGKRPELEAVMINCIMTWPFVEAEMAVLLGLLLKADNPAALAVFQALRRSSSQREAISEAAKASLGSQDQELISAVLNVHKSIEAERNALVHGHFGTATSLPDALIWQNTNDFVTFRAGMTLSPSTRWDDDLHRKLLASIWVYRKGDLEIIFREISALVQIWYDLTRYLQFSPENDGRVRDEAYSQLCGQSRIAQELENIRRKNNPSTPLP